MTCSAGTPVQTRSVCFLCISSCLDVSWGLLHTADVPAPGWRSCRARTQRRDGTGDGLLSSTDHFLDHVPPLLRVRRRVRLEVELRRRVERIANLAARHVLSLQAEFDAVNPADHALRQIQRQLRRGIFVEVVVVLELVQVPRRRDDVVPGVVSLHDGARLPFERSFDQRLR